MKNKYFKVYLSVFVSSFAEACTESKMKPRLYNKYSM